jgi:radical SAM superfamily enzyme YgiQ (UPF0313 family)
MKLLLINPYLGQVSKSTEGATHSPPLGLGFIATYVRDHTECDVQIIDPIPQGLTMRQILDEVMPADFVGLSVYTDTRFYCFDLAKKIKEINPKCKLIIGGVHAFFLSELILEHYPFIDLVVRGEGEETVVEIVQGRAYGDILGVTWKNAEGKIIRNPDRPLIKDIDPLYIDYELLPDMSMYKTDIDAPIGLKRLKTAYMIESRGCPFKCTFCANQHWKGRWRTVSPVKTVEKMSHLVKKYGIEYFRFYDDLFTANKKRVFEFCEALKGKKLDIKFRVLVRGDTSREVLEALKEVGCESVGIGIESGSDKILKRIRKGVTRQQLTDTIKMCQEVGLWVVGSLIVSLPDESKEDFKETLSLVPLPDNIISYIFHINPGTTFYEELRERGEINDHVWFSRNRYEGLIIYCKENFPSAPLELQKAIWLARYRRYYFFIHRPLRTIKQYGLFTGLLVLIFTVMDILFKGRLYDIAYKYRSIYRKFTMKK